MATSRAFSRALPRFSTHSNAINGIRAARTLHTSTRYAQESSAAEKNKQNLLDKDSMNPVGSEYSKTGGGDEAAAHHAQAFEPDHGKRDPQSEGKDAEGYDPLKVSPGNKAANQFRPGSENSSQSASSPSAERGERKTSGGSRAS